MPSVQLTLIHCEMLVEYYYVKELLTRRELSSHRNAPVSSAMQIYGESVVAFRRTQMQVRVHAYAKS